MKAHHLERICLELFSNHLKQIVLDSNPGKHKAAGFLGGKCSRGGGNRGTPRIPGEDWGTLGNIRED